MMTHFRNQAGNMVIALFMVITMAVIGLGVLYSQRTIFQEDLDRRNLMTGNLKAFVYSTTSLLLSQDAFIRSAKAAVNDPFWSCLNDPNFDCAVNGSREFTLFADDGSTFVDAAANWGLDRQMRPCTGYPSDTCAFRFELKWSRTCLDAGPCRAPTILISGDLLNAGFVNGHDMNRFRIRFVVR